MAIYQIKMKRGLREFVSIGQVIIVLSCQLVLAMCLHVLGISRKTLTVETADQSCELNVPFGELIWQRCFHLPFSTLSLFRKKGFFCKTEEVFWNFSVSINLFWYFKMHIFFLFICLIWFYFLFVKHFVTLLRKCYINKVYHYYNDYSRYVDGNTVTLRYVQAHIYQTNNYTEDFSKVQESFYQDA